VVRREMRPPSDSKSPRPVSRRGLDGCDDEDMPVICPTAQDFLSRIFERSGIEEARGQFPGAGSIVATMNICR
jgi:hypothetical protein